MSDLTRVSLAGLLLILLVGGPLCAGCASKGSPSDKASDSRDTAAEGPI